MNYQCEYCGKFIKIKDFEDGKAHSYTHYSSGPEPEPVCDYYHHIECKEKNERKA